MPVGLFKVGNHPAGDSLTQIGRGNGLGFGNEHRLVGVDSNKLMESNNIIVDLYLIPHQSYQDLIHRDEKKGQKQNYHLRNKLKIEISQTKIKKSSALLE